ncbi:NSs [Ketapang virus]|uniref:Non-structural protein NS-S n=1 Tax=Ketapang virus TaxID=2748196 RepID=A0A7D9MVX2_9VIRU|nr:NSs [Ketapang virus]QLA47058.1 NSs [Ketapang virus]
MYFEFPDESQQEQEQAWMVVNQRQFGPEDLDQPMEVLEEQASQFIPPNNPFQEQILLLGTEMTEWQVHLILQSNTWHLKIDTRSSCCLITLGPSSSTQERPSLRWQILTRRRYASLLVHSQWSWLIIIDRSLQREWLLTMSSRFIDSPDMLLDSFLSRLQ